jgi:hypothetical protein
MWYLTSFPQWTDFVFNSSGCTKERQGGVPSEVLSARRWWLMPVILAQEAEFRRIMV